MSRIPLAIAVGTATAVVAALTAGAASAQPARSATVPAGTSPAAAADALVAAKPAYLHASAAETFQRHEVITSGGLSYVPYTRTYKGLPVKGGDFVVMTDASGAAKYTSVAQSGAIGELSVTPKISGAAALAIAERQLKSVSGVEGTDLVVVAAESGPAKLAWQSTINGTGADGVSRLTVDVDALSGKVLGVQEHVTEVTGTGNGAIYGSVSLETTQSGSTFLMQDPAHTTVRCQNASGNATFSGPDNVWGNGNGTNRETGCVDALFVAERQFTMLSSWLGRNGQSGSGGAWPIRIGLNDENAFYDGTQVQIGHNTAGQWVGSADVVGHELGHGIDDHTPGGISRRGTQEFVADTFGAATEWFINSPADPPDYQVGEEINLVGSGPIRFMYNPSLAGDANCYSNSTPTQEVHAAAGPGNHWFYLLAQGSAAAGGQPASPTCNGTAVTGVGIQNAIRILYNAMLMKTTASSYLRYRVWTLQAAKNLTPGNCTQFNAVRAAWNAVSVPVQTGEPTC